MSQLSTEWIVEGRVMFLRVSGHITGEELAQYDTDMVALLDSVKTVGLVHFIEDMRNLTNAPPLSVSLRLNMIRDPRLGWSISIGAVTNPWLRLVYQSLVMTMRLRWRDVASVEQALQYVQRIDPSLPDLSGWNPKQ